MCHYKLDPVGQTFLTSPYSLSPLAATGALVYRDNRTNALINTPVTGLGQLGVEITKQPQYVRCQVRKFWNWFIGEDRTLSDARLDQLVTDFEHVGRKTNDFVEVMVTAPEFRTREFRTPEEIRVDQVQKVFSYCVKCHDAAKIPDFNAWPIGGSKGSMSKWLGEISDSLDLAHDGAQREMPPKSSGWQPDATDLELIKAWINDGAPDAKGQPQI